MRLLQCSERGELSIHSFDDNAIPPYAILSHTWGQDGDEVTFADLETGDGRTKPGYEKIRFCGQQARQDGLRYFWVDTCCIDKTDKAELSHAIQSMFRWYQDAKKCYVYLSDVSIRKRKLEDALTDKTWEPAFIASQWFTRGWTLQELLAPTTVEFFSQEGKKLGSKRSLKSLITKITGIPHDALNGTPLSQFSVTKRLRWKGDRQTKIEEDVWYSLSGILSVEIAPAYSEGAQNAFKRLMDEVHKLERCIQDIYSTDPRNDKKRIEDTKGGLLADSYRWVLDNITFRQWQEDQHSRLLWIKGDPGKGKTMLLCGIIDELHNTLPRNALLAYFFCQATDSRINSATAVLRGLLYMLVSQQPSLVSHIRNRHDYAGKALFEDANAWVTLTEMFADVLQDPQLRTTYLVIDALDECVTDRSKLLDFVAKQSSASHCAKWIVASRNWPDIEEQLELAERKTRLSLELNVESVAAAVKVFIEQRVNQLAQEKRYALEIKDAVLKHLTLNANGTFLWVALVCQNLRGTPKWSVLRKLAYFPPGLDSLYQRMMDQISKSDSAEICLQVLAVTTALYRPVTVTELVALVQQLKDVNDLESVQEIIGLCGSFLTLREGTVYFVHQSAKDFLFTEATNKIFPDGSEQVHQEIFLKSLAILSGTLRRDMYSLKALGSPIENAEPPSPDPLAESRYPCVYWIDHLYDSKTKFLDSSVNSLQVKDVIMEFLEKKYIYWLEGLSLCRSVGSGIVSVEQLWSLVQDVQDQNELTQLVYDARRFVMYHRRAIESFPLQTYASALLFSPRASLVRRLFQHEEPQGVTIKPEMGNGWSACLQTFEGHGGSVRSVAFSHDSARLASASKDQTVKIWDASNGVCLQTLKGHSSWVSSVTFSHDSAMLASASRDKTIKIWDAGSGACLQTLEGHGDWVNSVAFSHDSARLASASRDKTVKIWDASSGACLQTLEGHSHSVWSVAFSHDSARLASGSGDSTVKIWDASSGACMQTLKAHGHGVSSVAFSHDSARLASVSDDKTVKMWDANSGWVVSVAASPDLMQLTSTYSDSTVKIWDASNGACLQTLKGHSSWVSSVTFSYDSAMLASSSWDSTVKIWDASSGACLKTLEGHGDRVWSVAFSHDSARLASVSDDKTVKMWDANSGWVVSVAASPDLMQLTSTYSDSTVKTWDAGSGACLQTLEGHSDWASSVTFSHDSMQLASASHDATVKIWDAGSGACLKTLEGHSHQVNSVAFSPDSMQLASASHDSTVKIWDASSGTCLQTLKGHSNWASSVTFSHDSMQLASASHDATVKIWDASSGACLQTLEGHSDSVNSVAFSPDSTQLVSKSWNNIKIWDASSGVCLQTLEDYNDSVCSAEFVSILTVLHSNKIMTKSQQPVRQRIAITSLWISDDAQNTLWLPTEYRAWSAAVSGRCVGIGTASGKVWICCFK